MKRAITAFVIVIVALFMIIPLATSAATLPDYATDSSLAIVWACDSGKTTVKVYINEEQEWAVLEFVVSSGGLLVYLATITEEGFYIKPGGTDEMKALPGVEFRDLLKALAPEALKRWDRQSNDCTVKAD